MTPDPLLGTITRTGGDAEVAFDRVYDYRRRRPLGDADRP